MKRLALALILLAIGSSYPAASSAAYPIGGYSQIQLVHAKDPELVFDSLGVYLERAGYNTVLYSMYANDIETGKLSKALAGLGRHSLNSVIDDWTWKDKGPIGVTPMAYGNYLKMETEYKLSYSADKFVPDQLPMDDSANNKFNYVFRHDTGNRNDAPSKAFSNGYAWICDAQQGHKSGLMLTEPRFRWKPDRFSNSRVIGADLKFYPDAKGNRLYLRLALDFSSTIPGAPIATIKLTALDLNKRIKQHDSYTRYPDDSYIELPLNPLKPELYGTTIFNNDYQMVSRDKLFGNYIFEYYVELPEPGSQLYKDTMNGEFFNHLNPQVYWHGEGQLSLDYIELEDEIHKALDDPDHILRQRLNQRLKDIAAQPGSSSITYLYGKDEPFQGQFSAYHKLDKYLETMGKKLITATHLEILDAVKPGNLPNYSHYGLFLDEAKPRTMMLDAFPITEFGSGLGTLIRWNKDFDSEHFVQNKIQRGLLANYHYLAKALKQDPRFASTQLFFVPQSYGEKYDPIETGEWRYFMPPRSMQKCLQLLPLCYAADGIIDFAIISNPDAGFPSGTRTYKRIAPLMHGPGYADISVNPHTESFRQLMEANAKIAVYGPIIQGLKWLEADSLMVQGSHPSLDIGKLGLHKLEVLAPGDGHYAGYVQCGYYLNKAGQPSFMLVNRRAVFQKDDSPAIVPWDVDNYFVDAAPQTVRFRYKAKGSQLLFDPFSGKAYSAKRGSITVVLPPGDGVLLQTASTLPSKLKGQRRIESHHIITGKLTLKKGAKLLLNPSSSLHIADNSTLVINKNAHLDLQGYTSFGKNVKIIVKKGAKFDFDKSNTMLAADTIIKYY